MKMKVGSIFDRARVTIEGAVMDDVAIKAFKKGGVVITTVVIGEGGLTERERGASGAGGLMEAEGIRDLIDKDEQMDIMAERERDGMLEVGICVGGMAEDVSACMMVALVKREEERGHMMLSEGEEELEDKKEEDKEEEEEEEEEDGEGDVVAAVDIVVETNC